MTTVRPATPADAAVCADIYRPYVESTVVSFETEPPTAAEMAERIRASVRWLVAESGGDVVGYAYAGSHRARPAYRFACDVSAYLRPDARGRGVGTALYDVLLTDLTGAGFHLACAGVAQPNPASVALHRRCGFTEVGTYREVGWKHDAWHDVTWFQRHLALPGTPPPSGR